MVGGEVMRERWWPFVRMDNWGSCGDSPRDLRTRLAFYARWVTLVPVFRFLLALLIIVCFYMCSLVFTLLGLDERRHLLRPVGRTCARLLVAALGFRLQKHRVQGCKEGEWAPCIVSNHVSYMDIPVILAEYWGSFIAKGGTAHAPLIGTIGKGLNCLFIERSQGGSSSQVRDEILKRAQAEERQSPIAIFPEGTTTNNAFLISFRRGAFLAGQPVKPVILKYHYSCFSPAWETCHFVPHLMHVLTQPKATIELLELPVYCPTEEERKDPSLFAENVRHEMARRGGLELCDATIDDKREYHAYLSKGRSST